MTEGSRTSQRLPLQAGGKKSAQDEVISGMKHQLTLILTEVLNQIAQAGVAIKG